MAKQHQGKPAPPSPARRVAPLSGRVHVVAGAALIGLLTSLAYFPALSGGFILDDHVLLTEAPLIKAADGLYRMWFTTAALDYWPVTNTSLWIEWRLWAMNPRGYHVTNVLLHVTSTWLIWAILRRLSIPGAFLAALLFAVHPVNVESVAWIAQRKNLLALLFFLLSILWYLNAESRSPAPAGVAARPAERWYWLSLLAFVLAMLSKGSVAVLPPLLLLILWWRRPLTWRDWMRLAPFFVVSVALVLVNVWFQARFTKPDLAVRSFAERGLGAGAAVWFYVYKALLPVHLSFVYPKWQIDARQVRWWLPLLAALGATGVMWWHRHGWSRGLLCAWGFFCVALVPVMGFTDVGFMQHSLVADHYQHVALVGVIALAAAAWGVWHRRGPGLNRWLANAAAVSAAGVLAVLTWRQSALYSDAITLFEATLAENPQSAFVHNNLGLALREGRRSAEAREHFEQALRIRPDFPEVHYNLARVLQQAGQAQEAIAHFREAVRLRPTYPEYHYELGGALAHTRQVDAAIAQFQQALNLRPTYPEAHNDLGALLLESGRLEEAIEHYELAVRFDADFPAAHYNLGTALIQAGRQREAIEHLQEAVRLAPTLGGAHNDLGVALANAGRLDDAIAQFQQAVLLEPDDRHARNNLEETLEMKQKANAAAPAPQ